MRIASKIGLLVLALSGIASANQAFLVKCDISGQFVVTAGLNSTNKVEQTFPGCTVTVFIHSSATLATIFSDNIGTPLANPFTTPASGLTPGQQFVYANNGRYDFVISGAGISSPVTISDVLLNDSVAQLSSTPCPLAFSSTPVFTAGTCSIFSMTLTGNVTSSTITGGITGQIIVISLTQGTGGPWTFQFPSAFLNPPTLTPTAGNGEQFSFVLLNDGKWHNVSIGEFPINQFSNITGTGNTVVMSSSPSVTGTDNGVETLNNKTLGSPVLTGTASGAATIPPTMLNSLTGTGAACLATNCSLATPSLSSPTSTGTDNGTETLVNKSLTSPTSTGTDNGTETLVNKSLTSPTSTGTDNGTETLVNKTLTSPTSTGTDTGTETLTNKTLTSPTSTGTDNGTETLVNKTLTSPTSTGTDNGTETLQNKTISGLRAAGSLVNTGSLQAISMASCTTAAGQFSGCDTTITWNPAFSDTNYNFICQITQNTNAPVIIGSNNKLAATVKVSIETLSNPGAASGTLICWAWE